MEGVRSCGAVFGHRAGGRREAGEGRREAGERIFLTAKGIKGQVDYAWRASAPAAPLSGNGLGGWQRIKGQVDSTCVYRSLRWRRRDAEEGGRKGDGRREKGRREKGFF